MDRTTRLLDAIEDAEADLAHALAKRRWLIVAYATPPLLIATLLLLGFVHRGFAGTGFLLACLAVITGFGMASTGSFPSWPDIPQARTDLRNAQRAHRNHLMETQ